jgi:uncharacterized protein YecT (DUF1311 family)
MRLVVATALIAFALPAGAQDFTYDPTILTDCLQAEEAQPNICVSRAAMSCTEGEGGSSTVGIVSCFEAEQEQWAAIMADSYDILMADAQRTDQDMKDLGSAAEPQAPLLDAMQAKWAAYRDEACAWDASRWSGGSGAGPAAAACDTELTGQQALRLKVYADQVMQ